ncbi:MAG: RNA polymerase sigma factor [Sediminibacterium sp.]|jgi:RNA polymerase sigma factor (sigma-70 family)|nr:RNA polymerase sigma factor [Sediminibacterium sp.]
MTEQDYNNCVDEHSNGVYRFIVKNIRNTQDAEDIVQSAYEKLWVNRERVTPLKAKSYLFTVAYHQMIDVIRKENKKPTTNEYMEVDQVTHQTSSELKQNLLSAVNLLNHTQKCLVLLKDYEGYSYQEIGEIMNLSESQVKVYLHRARLFLKTKLLELEKINA